MQSPRSCVTTTRTKILGKFDFLACFVVCVFVLFNIMVKEPL